MTDTPQRIERRSSGRGASLAAKVGAGVPLPLGAHLRGTGINFAIFSRHATNVSLLLFDDQQDHTPRSAIALDPWRNRTGDIWHLSVDGIGLGSLYAWRVDGLMPPSRVTASIDTRFCSIPTPRRSLAPIAGISLAPVAMSQWGKPRLVPAKTT